MEKLHGQHLVIESVVRAVRGHMTNKEPQKALVLSFHGWTGGGKNYVTRFIADHLYLKGLNSHYVHLFVSTLHFSHMKHLETYKVCPNMSCLILVNDLNRKVIKNLLTYCVKNITTSQSRKPFYVFLL